MGLISHSTSSDYPTTWASLATLLARRVTAYLLETIPIQLAASVASGPAIAAAIRHYSPWSRSEGELIGANTSLAVGAACSLAWFLARDAIPGASWGKYLLGLRVVSAQPGVEHEPPALHARLLRNLGFVVPLFMLVEGLVALTVGRGRRLGDLLCGTRVLPRAGVIAPWSDLDGILLSMAVLLTVAGIVAGRYITEAMFNWNYWGTPPW